MKSYIAAAFALQMTICCPDPNSPFGQLFHNYLDPQLQYAVPRNDSYSNFRQQDRTTPAWIPPDRQQDYPWTRW